MTGPERENVELVTGFQDVRSRRTMTLGNEIRRCEIEQHGRYLGTVVYVRRQHRNGGSTYGWRPERSAASARLTTKGDAVAAVLAAAVPVASRRPYRGTEK